MDPRFRRNHQLHLLLKKRTYVADHELYEMMRSKQVYRAQNDLRRELERRLQEIKLDRKVRIASFMVQKATFIKMMAAREKGLRHLLNVKKHIGEEFAECEEDQLDYLREDEQISDNIIFNEQEHGLDGYNENLLFHDILNSRDLNSSLRNNQDTYFIQSVNNEWMEVISKKSSQKGKSKQKEKNLDSSKTKVDKRAFKDRGITPNLSKEISVRLKPTPITSLEELNNNTAYDQNPKQPSVQQKSHVTSVEQIMINDNKICQDHRHQESRPPKVENDKNESLQSKTNCITLPAINFESNGLTLNDSLPKKVTSSLSVSSPSLLQPLPPISKTQQSKKLLEVPHVSPLPKTPEPQQRERSVTMLFVEGSDDDDDDYLSQVSAFDIEAFSKCHRRKRGYSIIVSSIDLYREDEKERGKNTELKKKNTKKTKMTIKYPHHPNSWGVKATKDISPRQRSNQWYQDFLTGKNSKKLKNKSMQRSHNFEIKGDLPHSNYPHQRGEDVHLWKTPSSSDSQQSQELYQIKLQRLKQHCQLLSQRVALFISS